MLARNNSPTEQVHGTAIAISGLGVLLRGPSGAGKSDLALRLIDSGARLVADDRVDISVRRGRVWASPPRTLAGLIEARGVGIVRVAHLGRVALGLVVDLVKPEQVERLPDAMRCRIAGVALPRLKLTAVEASAPAKVRLALKNATRRRRGKR